MSLTKPAGAPRSMRAPAARGRIQELAPEPSGAGDTNRSGAPAGREGSWGRPGHATRATAGFSAGLEKIAAGEFLPMISDLDYPASLARGFQELARVVRKPRVAGLRDE